MSKVFSCLKITESKVQISLKLINIKKMLLVVIVIKSYLDEDAVYNFTSSISEEIK